METNRGNRIHIAIFGQGNVGKSSIMNALTEQEVATVSEVLGTTTDPVYKSMELSSLGPVVLIDTAGLYDESVLGEKRMAKTRAIMNKTDIALYIVDVNEEIDDADIETLKALKDRKLPVIMVFNKADSGKVTLDEFLPKVKLVKPLISTYTAVSAKNGAGIQELKKLLITASNELEASRVLIGDLVSAGDLVVLVTPIDKSAPKGRLILPQQQTIRDLLDHGAISIVVREVELEQTLNKIGHQVKLVVTDAQVFEQVNKTVPESIPLTSFSILFARFKGELEMLARGVSQIKKLKADDKVLICEACTHHRHDGDIGKDKIPELLRKLSGVKLDFSWYSGTGFPDEKEISSCDFIVHCGGCMINQKEMQYRLDQAKKFNIPIVNYGIFFAYASGALKRATKSFPEISAILEEVDLL